jgi:uncharacterized protein (TIGR00369 family)
VSPMTDPTRDYASIPLDSLKTMSGLDLMQSMLTGRLPGPPIARTLGFTMLEVAFGRAVFQCTPSLDHYNPLGGVHGGLYGTLLDSCMGCAVHTALPAGSGYTTLEYGVHLVRGMTDQTGPVRAEGKIVHVGRRMATAEGRIVDAEGRLYAHGTTTCMILQL